MARASLESLLPLVLGADGRIWLSLDLSSLSKPLNALFVELKAPDISNASVSTDFDCPLEKNNFNYLPEVIMPVHYRFILRSKVSNKSEAIHGGFFGLSGPNRRLFIELAQISDLG